jgi:hypothetical protein
MLGTQSVEKNESDLNVAVLVDLGVQNPDSSWISRENWELNLDHDVSEFPKEITRKPNHNDQGDPVSLGPL